MRLICKFVKKSRDWIHLGSRCLSTFQVLHVSFLQSIPLGGHGQIGTEISRYNGGNYRLVHVLFQPIFIDYLCTKLWARCNDSDRKWNPPRPHHFSFEEVVRGWVGCTSGKPLNPHLGACAVHTWHWCCQQEADVLFCTLVWNWTVFDCILLLSYRMICMRSHWR